MIIEVSRGKFIPLLSLHSGQTTYINNQIKKLLSKPIYWDLLISIIHMMEMNFVLKVDN
jgi:hypothetical protein